MSVAAFASAQVSPTATPYSSPPSAGATASPSPAASASTWDPMAEMQRMQREMDHFFSRAMSEFGMNQNFLSMRNEPGFSSSIDVRDKGDHYEVHALLPNRDIANVKISAEGNNRLRIAAVASKKEKKTDKNSEMLMQEWGDYEQVVTLPGPANTNKMQVDRKEHEIVVSVPKSKA